MYIISLSCIIYTYCKLILKSPSGRINQKVLSYCTITHHYPGFILERDNEMNNAAPKFLLVRQVERVNERIDLKSQ